MVKPAKLLIPVLIDACITMQSFKKYIGIVKYKLQFL